MRQRKGCGRSEGKSLVVAWGVILLEKTFQAVEQTGRLLERMNSECNDQKESF